MSSSSTQSLRGPKGRIVPSDCDPERRHDRLRRPVTFAIARFGLVALVALSACDASRCVRHSDCSEGLICSAGSCVRPGDLGGETGLDILTGDASDDRASIPDVGRVDGLDAMSKDIGDAKAKDLGDAMAQDARPADQLVDRGPDGNG